MIFQKLHYVVYIKLRRIIVILTIPAIILNIGIPYDLTAQFIPFITLHFLAFFSVLQIHVLFLLIFCYGDISKNNHLSRKILLISSINIK
jgi:hypothetical protein